MKGTTFTIKCAKTDTTYIRTEENLFDDLFDILDYNNDSGRFCKENTSLSGRLNGGSMDDSYLGEAVGVREILAWVLSPGFHAYNNTEQREPLEDLLKRIQEAEASPTRMRPWKGDYTSL
jgi:hypothetical protein